MDKDTRYNSGTSLIRTRKEETIDYLERMIGAVSDETYIQLKKLTVSAIQELHKVIAERINQVYEEK